MNGPSELFVGQLMVGSPFSRKLIAPGIAHNAVQYDALEAMIGRNDLAFPPGTGGQCVAGKIKIEGQQISAVHD